MSNVDQLVLEPLKASAKIRRWPATDYNVRCGSKVVGRLMRSYYAPSESPWAWSINAFERGSRPYEKCQGFAANLDSALNALRLAWTERSDGES